MAAGLALAGITAIIAVRTRLTRPFWYDEVWRGHFVGEPLGTFWGELAGANVPSALGWIGLTRVTGEVFGWHVASLRAPSVLALPLLAVATYALARRFTGVVPAALAGLALAVSGTVVDLGTQLKPYTIEALVTIGVVALWTADTAPARVRLARRCAAGMLALFSVPAVFVIVPLALADVLLGTGGGGGGGGGGGVRRRVWAAALATPALAIAGLHALLFVAHQSAQRGGTYWDTHFLADRDAGEALRFVGAQLLAILSGAPPGVDGPDINVVHPVTDGTAVSTWLIAPATGVALLAGALRLARGRRAPPGSGVLEIGTVETAASIAPNSRTGRGHVADGRLLLAALVGAEVLQLAASALRYWPFGPVRTNLFVVPLIVVVVAVGAADIAHAAARPARLARRGCRGRVAGGPGWTRRATAAVSTVVVVVVLAVVAVVPVAGASALRPLAHAQDRLRSIELLVDATVVTRRLYQPGDLVVVGGRLARPGWLYSMERSDDSPYPADGDRGTDGAVSGGSAPVASVPGAPRTPRVPPRVPREATVFLQAVGESAVARAVAGRTERPRQVVVFVLAYDRRGTRQELDAMRAEGWCETGRWNFELTGTLHSLTRCDVPAPSPGNGPDAVGSMPTSSARLVPPSS